MNKTSVVLSLSLLGNLALAALVVTRSSAPSTVTPGPTTAATHSTLVTGNNADALRAALASGDAAALQAAGVAADVAHDIALGRAFGRFAEKMRSAQNATANGKWWRRTTPGGAASREQLLAARRELSEAMIAAFGDDLGIGGTDNNQLAFLPQAKRDALRRITQDYDEMLAKFGGEGGIQLASDREKQKLLRAERDRDIAALLSPDELAAYEMRTSATAASIRQRYGDAIDSEEEFKKIYALQKAFDDKFPAPSGRITPDMMAARADATRQLQEDLKSAVGPDKYSELRRASDADMRTLDSLAARLNLPPNTADSVLNTRDSYASESQRINADASLTPAQRRAQIQELGNRARNDVAKSLGSEGTEAYAQRATWLSLLQNGVAFTTTPQPNSPGALNLGGVTQSVYPVMPAGGGVAGARQMIVNSVTASDSNASGPAGIFVAPVERAVQRDNVVMTFTATSADAPTPAPNVPPANGAGNATIETRTPPPKQ